MGKNNLPGHIGNHACRSSRVSPHYAATTAILNELIDTLKVIYPSGSIIERAISLRQQRKMSLGDALIAATCLEHNEPLATANVDDFKWIAGLEVVNPLANLGA